jgi:hypothetical protein
MLELPLSKNISEVLSWKNSFPDKLKAQQRQVQRRQLGDRTDFQVKTDKFSPPRSPRRPAVAPPKQSEQNLADRCMFQLQTIDMHESYISLDPKQIPAFIRIDRDVKQQ